MVCFLSSKKTRFTKDPPFGKRKIKWIPRGDSYEKRAKETQPYILHGGHRNPYQLENAVKSGGTVFSIYNLG